MQGRTLTADLEFTEFLQVSSQNMKASLQLLGIVLAPIVSALNLTEVVLAGPASHISGPLLTAAQSTLRESTLADSHGDVQLRMTELGHDLIVLGAVVLVLRGQLGVS